MSPLELEARLAKLEAQNAALQARNFTLRAELDIQLAVFDAVPYPMFNHDELTRFRAVNKAYAQAYATSTAEMQGLSVLDITARKDAERTGQGDATSTRKHGGTGLGISKQLALLMDCKVGVESTLGFGFTFCFTALPAPNSHALRDDPQLNRLAHLLTENDAEASELLAEQETHHKALLSTAHQAMAIADFGFKTTCTHLHQAGSTSTLTASTEDVVQT